MNRKNKLTPSVTALYCRLSIEDGRENESMSISNQKALLRDFAEKNGLLDYEFYVDDGYTGRNRYGHDTIFRQNFQQAFLSLSLFSSQDSNCPQAWDSIESMSISNQENICQGGFYPKDEIPP